MISDRYSLDLNLYSPHISGISVSALLDFQKFQKGHCFFINIFSTGRIFLEQEMLRRIRPFLFFRREDENGTVIKKGTGIAPSCCKKRITPERRRYATTPKETERKICSRSELCIGCPFPASGFICWGSGEDCLRSRYMKLQNREESK